MIALHQYLSLARISCERHPIQDEAAKIVLEFNWRSWKKRSMPSETHLCGQVKPSRVSSQSDMNQLQSMTILLGFLTRNAKVISPFHLTNTNSKYYDDAQGETLNQYNEAVEFWSTSKIKQRSLFTRSKQLKLSWQRCIAAISMTDPPNLGAILPQNISQTARTIS